MGLTRKQQLFLSEYLIDMNATQAAIRAGYSEKTAYSIGQELLKKPEISGEIQRKINEKALKAEEVLEKLTAIASGDIGEFVFTDPEGKIKVDLEKAQAQGKTFLIRKVKQRKGDAEIELYSALDALELLGKYHKLFVDRTEITGQDGDPLVNIEQIDKALRKIYGNNSNS